jgi:serine/threonine protein kinase
MSNTIDIWKKYKKINVIGIGIYGKVYKVQNIENGYYYAIKEIDKTENTLSNIKILKELKIENNLIKEIIDTKEYLYIIMELCEYNLENYIKKREDLISINEIREILIQLNNTFKIMLKEKIIHGDLKLNNILISFNKLDKCLIKLSFYDSNQFIKQSDLKSIIINENILTISPEVLKGEEDLSKSDIWSLGIIIYYMLFKEYPYKGKGEIELLEDINSGKVLKLSDNEKLNDLLNKMLKIDLNERISWEEYFNHPFFINQINLPSFDIICKNHSKELIAYCSNCKCNICEVCLNNHPGHTHKVIFFTNIGLSENENKEIDKLIKEIEININSFNQIKKFINSIKSIKDNNSIYNNDDKNNYKQYSIQCLNIIKENIKKIENISLPKIFKWELR